MTHLSSFSLHLALCSLLIPTAALLGYKDPARADIPCKQAHHTASLPSAPHMETGILPWKPHPSWFLWCAKVVSPVNAGNHDRWCTTTINECSYTALSTFRLFFVWTNCYIFLPLSVKSHYFKSIQYLNYILLNILSVFAEQCKVKLCLLPSLLVLPNSFDAKFSILWTWH